MNQSTKFWTEMDTSCEKQSAMILNKAKYKYNIQKALDISAKTKNKSIPADTSSRSKTLLTCLDVFLVIGTLLEVGVVVVVDKGRRAVELVNKVLDRDRRLLLDPTICNDPE